MNNRIEFLWDEESKYEVRKMIDLDSVIEQGPCAEILVKVIKSLPEEILNMQIDPDSYYTMKFEQNLNKFVRALKKLPDVISWDVLNFLEGCGFLKWYEPTDDEYKRYMKNERRREQRKKAKKTKSR
jgi:hypothetical protein